MDGSDEQIGGQCEGCDDLLLLNLSENDIVDVVQIDGDIRAVGNRGTVLSGFHIDGIVTLDPAPTDYDGDHATADDDHDDTKFSRRDTAGADTARGFFGEMARFAGGGRAFTTIVTGGQDYVCGAYYQESAHQASRAWAVRPFSCAPVSAANSTQQTGGVWK
jgi:hypothetical protein